MTNPNSNRPTLSVEPVAVVVKPYNVNDTIELLIAKFPLAFFPVESAKKPLVVGVTRVLFELDLGVSNKKIRDAVRRYTRQSSYHQSIVAGVARVNLDGSDVLFPSRSIVEYSTKVLSDRGLLK